MAAFPDSFSTTQITGHKLSPITQPGPKNNRERACVTIRTGIVRTSFQKTRNERNFLTRTCSSIAMSAAAARSTLSEKMKSRRQRYQRHSHSGNRQQFPAE